ncbi:MAG: hypothetical protein JWP35_811 [Caulobacter sp.]|nr:hypothetical protein [Caulobacter sp.]
MTAALTGELAAQADPKVLIKLLAPLFQQLLDG